MRVGVAILEMHLYTKLCPVRNFTEPLNLDRVGRHRCRISCVGERTLEWKSGDKGCRAQLYRVDNAQFQGHHLQREVLPGVVQSCQGLSATRDNGIVKGNGPWHCCPPGKSLNRTTQNPCL